MPKHVVEQGECLNSIARAYGFADAKAIYEAPGNESLGDKRKDMNVLFPGDEITIPDRKPKSVTCAVEKRHTFKVTLPRKRLVLKLSKASGAPLADAAYSLEIGGSTIEGKTGGDGSIDEPIPVDARTAILRLDGLERTLHIGALNPMDQAPDGGVSGVRARLKNLGYFQGEINAEITPDESPDADTELQSAIVAYLLAKGVTEPDGAITPDLIKRLTDDHGA